MPRARHPKHLPAPPLANEPPLAKDPAFAHDPAAATDPPTAALSRRSFCKGAGVTGLAAATSRVALGQAAEPPSADGTPEQIHLTWGDEMCSCVIVSWSTPGQALHAHVQLDLPAAGHAAAQGSQGSQSAQGAHAAAQRAHAAAQRAHEAAQGAQPAQSAHTRRVVHAVQRTYTDGLNGRTVFTYHARLEGLAPDTTFQYAVTADNDRNKARPFRASFRSAPRGRRPFRWTSYGDLATPNTAWILSSPQSRHAVQAVERFKPLFHLLNGDLCYANLNHADQPAVWADFGNNVQRSAAFRPWMPCTGNHEIEFGNGPLGLDSYRTRYTLPGNGSSFAGLWYRFRVGSVLFISLSADDVIYQDSGAFLAGPETLHPAPSTGNAPIAPGTSLYIHGYSGGEQTRWLAATLAAAASDAELDWIVVQMHQDALSSSRYGNGSDKGIREQWLPLFDRYGVDLVLCGHDHDYERSWPVRGCNHDAGRDAVTGATVDTCQPRPVLAARIADNRFDTRLGTIHFILGGGGTSAPLDAYGVNPDNGMPQAKVTTKANRPIPGAAEGTFVKPGADALEDAIWSARRDTDSAYGVAVFDLDPGVPDGPTSLTITYYHALGADQKPTPDYTPFETVVLTKDRKTPPST